MRVNNAGGLTIVRKRKKNGVARGTLYKDNLEEAVARGRGNIIYQSTILGEAKHERGK